MPYLILLFTLTFYLFPFAQNPDEWPIMHNINHTGFSQTTTLKPPLKIRWVTKVQGCFNAVGPVVAEKRVVIKSRKGYLFCLDSETGEILWRNFINYTHPSSAGGGPCISSGKVYVPFYVKGWPTLTGVYCYDLATGDSLWKSYAGYLGPRNRFSVQVADNKVFYLSNVDINQTTYPVGDYNFKSQVKAWDASTGDSLWTYTLFDTACNNQSMVIANDTIYATCGKASGSSEGKTAVLDLNGNEIRTSATYHCNGYVGAIQYLYGNILIPTGSSNGGTTNTAATLLRASDFSVVFQYGGGNAYSKIHVHMNNRLYARGYGGAPRVFNAATGAHILNCTTPDNFSSGCSPPVAANGYVYAGFGQPPNNPGVDTGHKWYAWNETGTPVWSFQNTSHNCPPLAIAYGRLYTAAGAEGMMYCFENDE